MTPTYATLRALRPACIGTETLFLREPSARLGSDSYSPLTFPDYQRGHVWTDAQAGRFMGFLLEWGTPPVIFVQRWAESVGLPDEVIDGKQRLTAIARWVNHEIPAIFADPSQPPMFLRDFTPAERQMLTGPGGPTLTIQYVGYTTRAEVMAFYLRLNTGGTPHSADEIERVRGMIAAESSGP